MQWFSMILKRKSPFEAIINISGQDINGTWVGEGSYVYT